MSHEPHTAENSNDSHLRDAFRRGASMEDIAKLREPNVSSTAEAIEELKRGNTRFFNGEVQRLAISPNERRAQIMGQTPFAAVLACSDSRVPVEVVFDQGLGDLFVVRVAGQIADPATMGSIEYAITHLKCHLVLILGHEGCGAVRAALQPDTSTAAEPEYIQYLVNRIKPTIAHLPNIRDPKARMREAVTRHVRAQVHEVRQSPQVKTAIERGQIAVIGGFYEISSGAVDFMLTEDELALDVAPEA